MTRKELQKLKEDYRALALDITSNPETELAQIAGVCIGIAIEGCYNHHERGQRIWAFFKALEEVTN